MANAGGATQAGAAAPRIGPLISGFTAAAATPRDDLALRVDAARFEDAVVVRVAQHRDVVGGRRADKQIAVRRVDHQARRLQLGINAHCKAGRHHRHDRGRLLQQCAPGRLRHADRRQPVCHRLRRERFEFIEVTPVVSCRPDRVPQTSPGDRAKSLCFRPTILRIPSSRLNSVTEIRQRPRSGTGGSRFLIARPSPPSAHVWALHAAGMAVVGRRIHRRIVLPIPDPFVE